MDEIAIGNLSLEGTRIGAGPPLLFLHGGDYVRQNRPFLERLGRHWRVLAPRHPGFGHSPRPDGFRTIHDLAYLYLDLLDQQDLRDVLLVGSSFGGWIALELAVRCCARLGRLVLIDALGVKFGGREERDIADIYALPEEELRRRTFRDPAAVVPDYTQLADAEIEAVVHDRQATALYGWRPYMHDPALRQWLHRVTVPSLVLWGEDDGIVTPEYGRKLAAVLPAARFETIAEAGHYPQIERPDAVAAAIARFAGQERGRPARESSSGRDGRAPGELR
jgi:pimeloyl-ACP methyl ester carboxylesterase